MELTIVDSKVTPAAITKLFTKYLPEFKRVNNFSYCSKVKPLGINFGGKDAASLSGKKEAETIQIKGSVTNKAKTHKIT